MIGSFIGKAKDVLDSRFLLAWWFPTLLSLSALLLIYSWPKGWTPLTYYLSVLQRGDYSLDFVTIFGVLLITLILAYLIQAFSHPLVQFWEGYWPSALWNSLLKARMAAKWKKLSDDRRTAAVKEEESYASLHERLFYGYPVSADRLLPTQLGNALRSAEDYAWTTYGMHAVFWWPRLWLILPKAVQEEIEGSLTPMHALLNLTTQISIVSVAGFLYLLWQQSQGNIGLLQPWIVLIGGLVLAYAAYRGAISHAKTHGMLIRSIVDLYRFDLLQALHQALPSNINEESELWDALIRWIYSNQKDKAPQYAHNLK